VVQATTCIEKHDSIDSHPETTDTNGLNNLNDKERQGSFGFNQETNDYSFPEHI
jgi:hypothetical protein